MWSNPLPRTDAGDDGTGTSTGCPHPPDSRQPHSWFTRTLFNPHADLSLKATTSWDRGGRYHPAAHTGIPNPSRITWWGLMKSCTRHSEHSRMPGAPHPGHREPNNRSAAASTASRTSTPTGWARCADCSADEVWCGQPPDLSTGNIVGRRRSRKIRPERTQLG